MQKRLLFVLLLAAVLAASGCARNPEKVFADLKDAALKKDARAIWANLTPETIADFTLRAQLLFAGKSSSTPDEGYEYLSMLSDNLDPLTVEYIKNLRASRVTITGDTAVMNLSSLRFGPPPNTLTFKKVDGKWLWDARDILQWYLEHREDISDFSQGGFQ